MSIAKPQRILISGGGIGGTTLAYFLRQQGFTPVTVESAPAFKRIGYLLALNKQIGQKVADKMGVLGTLKTFERCSPITFSSTKAARSSCASPSRRSC